VPGPREVEELVVAHVEPPEREAGEDWDVVLKDDIVSAAACERSPPMQLGGLYFTPSSSALSISSLAASGPARRPNTASP
jgi:hypothetical protein